MKGNLNDASDKQKKKDFITPSRARKERWKEIIVRLYLQGNSMETVRQKAQIESGGHSFGLNTVHKYIHEAIEEWKKNKEDFVQNHKAIELEKINFLEQTYWQGYVRSLTTMRTVKTRKTPLEVSENTGKTPKNTVKRGKKNGAAAETPYKTVEVTDEDRESAGDVRFLQGIDRCIELRLKLLGTDAMPKIEVSTTVNNNTATDNSTTIVRRVVFKTRETTAAPQTFINPENN